MIYSKLGNTDIDISRIGLGCMGMSEFYGTPNDKESEQIILQAVNEGVNLLDTADIYGLGKNEELLGSIISSNQLRNEIRISTKCGIRRDPSDLNKRVVCNDYNYILEACERSLNRLKVDSIDLFYLHRIVVEDEKMHESMEAMVHLLNKGLIKSVGLSEPSRLYVEKSNDLLIKLTGGAHTISAVQSEYSLMTRTVEENGVLDLCEDSNISFIPYSPISRGLLGNKIKSKDMLESDDFRRTLPRFSEENLEKNLDLTNKISKIAANLNCSTAQLSLGWLLNRSKKIHPIPGTRKIAHLLDNISSISLEISKKELEDIDALLNYFSPSGSRYSPQAMKAYNFSN